MAFYIHYHIGSHSGSQGLLSTAYETRESALVGLREMGASLRRNAPTVTRYEMNNEAGTLLIRHSDGTRHQQETVYKIVEV